MITEQIILTKLTSSDGMVLTDGESYGKEVYLGKNDTVERWSEIPESEMPIYEPIDDVSEEYNEDE